MLECLLATLQGKVDDRDGAGGELRVAVVGELDHLVTDGGLDYGLDGLLVGYVGQEVTNELVVALHLHGGGAEHPLQIKFLGRELQFLEFAGYVLHEDIVVDIGQQLYDVQTLDFALDHNYVLFALDPHLLVVYRFTLLANLQHLGQYLLRRFLRVPETQVDRLPQETQQSQQNPVVEIAFVYFFLRVVWVGLDGPEGFDAGDQSRQDAVEWGLPRFQLGVGGVQTDAVSSLHSVVVEQPSPLDNGVIVLTLGVEVVQQPDDGDFRLVKVLVLKQVPSDVNGEHLADLLLGYFVPPLR